MRPLAPPTAQWGDEQRGTRPAVGACQDTGGSANRSVRGVRLGIRREINETCDWPPPAIRARTVLLRDSFAYR